MYFFYFWIGCRKNSKRPSSGWLNGQASVTARFYRSRQTAMLAINFVCIMGSNFSSAKVPKCVNQKNIYTFKIVKMYLIRLFFTISLFKSFNKNILVCILAGPQSLNILPESIILLRKHLTHRNVDYILLALVDLF